jgi:O-antigen ligase
VGILAVAQLLFRDRYRVFLIASLGIISVALLLSLTRNAWLGMSLGAVTLLFLRDKRLLLLVPVVAVAVALVLPRDVERRLGSFFSPDSSGVDRVYMLRAGMEMVANHPWLGVGPDMVAEVYPVYVARDAPHRDNPHLHNNVMQIAAERGLPCLAAWLWILGIAFFCSVRAFRRHHQDPRGRALAAGSLGVLIAGFLAGAFEYNFGDSEFQMLFLFAMTIPWILDREIERDDAEAAT